MDRSWLSTIIEKSNIFLLYYIGTFVINQVTCGSLS